jgi:PAS domain S-box-containing protein
MSDEEQRSRPLHDDLIESSQSEVSEIVETQPSPLIASYLTTSGTFQVGEEQWTGLEGLLHGIPIPALLVDRQRKITFANEACRKLTGDPQILFGTDLLLLFQREYETTAARSLLESVFVNKKSRTCEGLLKFEKSKIWGRIHFRCLRLGVLQSALVLIEDLTLEKKQLLQNHRHQSELKRARDELEQRVRERTSELEKMNEQLRAEIEERKQAQEQVRQSEEKYRNLIELMNEGFVIQNEYGTITFANDKHCKMLEFGREEIIGRHISEFLDPTSFRILQQQRGRGREGKGNSCEVVYLGKNGRRIPAIISSRPFLDPDGYQGTAAVVTDITKLKATEAMLIRARDELEKRVEERTSDLAKTNEQLLFEITQRREIEAALRRSESRFRHLYDQAPVMMHSIDHDGYLRHVNAKWLNVLGYAQEEVIGRKFDFILAPQFSGKFEELLPKSWNGVQVKDFPCRFAKKDGSIIDVLLDSVNIDDPALGTVSLSVIRDITDKKLAEEALIASEERFRAVVEQQTDLICRTLGNGTITFANSSFVSFFGVHEEALIGSNLLDMVLNEDRKDIKEVMFALHAHAPSRTGEYRVLLPGGKQRWVHWNHKGIFNSQEQIVEIQSVGRDITDRKSMEDALKASEERTRLLIELSPVGIGIITNGRFAYVNPSFVQILGCESLDEIVGKTPEQFIHAEGRDFAGSWSQMIFSGRKKAIHGELKGLKNSGETFDAQVWVTRIDYAQQPSTLMFLADASEAKRLRAQLLHAQKMEAVGTLAGGIAHDFNNLLTGILGYADLLLEDKEEGDQDYSDIQKIIRSARHGAGLVQRILTFSRATETTPGPVNLNDIIRHVNEMLTRTLPKMIKIETDLAPDLMSIIGDASHLDQVVINFALNAKDAMPEGGRLLIRTQNIRIEENERQTHVMAKEGNYVQLTVGDDGEGIPAEIQDRIFEPFFTTKDPGKGTGLGLPMVYGIVKQHGGFTAFESEPGKGSVFNAFFPALASAADALEPKQFASPLRGKETILLADAEDYIRDLGSRCLVAAGYQVLMAANSRELIRIYGREHSEVALIILDPMMPDMGEKQCLKQLAEINPEVKVLLAGSAPIDTESVPDISIRPVDFVKKPFQKIELLQAVRRALDVEAFS